MNVNYRLTVQQRARPQRQRDRADSQIALATEVVLAGLATTSFGATFSPTRSRRRAGWHRASIDGTTSWKSGRRVLFDAKRPPRPTVGPAAVRTQLSLTNPPTAVDQT